MAERKDRLETYRAKRRPGATPEPFSAVSTTDTHLFVVHKHAATRLHFDFRLEWDGVLMSWAVPKGPSYDPNEKRFAAQTEDHPVDYADFEGVIPAGNYGAGEIIVWDRGKWTPLEDFEAGLKKGKLLFSLDGYKLRGVWTLVRLKDSKTEWLLIKHKDEYSGSPEPPEESVLSGLRVEELRAGSKRAGQLRRKLDRLHAPKDPVDPSKLAIMLAEVADKPFTADGWFFEIKYDGYRLIASAQRGVSQLFYRRGSNATALFPEIARALGKLPYESIVLDGEIVVNDELHRPSFQRLQQRAQLSRTRDIERAAIESPAILHVFDLLGFEGYDLRSLPLATRKQLLRDVLPTTGAVRYVDHIERRGEDMAAAAQELGLEGIMAKRADSRYVGRRSSDWLKLRFAKTGDFAVVGYTSPKRGRVGIGALHLAVRDGGGYRYAGKVGTGFSDRDLEDLRQRLEPARVTRPSMAGTLPTGRDNVWVEPKLVAEVRYREQTNDGHLRHPVFVRLRTDKGPEECSLPSAHDPAPDPPRLIEKSTPKVAVSNLGKVFWPDEGYTKGDLIEYYRRISPWLLTYLRDRPVVMVRYPDGINGKNFFQKDAPPSAPDWLPRKRIWSEGSERDIDYFICDNEEALVYLANLGTIPLHVWASRVDSLEQPDWCVLDLDPKGAAFTDVVKIALAIRALCDEIGLPSYPKTSGSTGLHVLVPLGRQLTFEQCRHFAEFLATVIVKRLPAIATIERAIPKRKGRVYVDFLQNGHGKLIVAPFSVRPVPGATVSTPLGWNEVKRGLDPTKFTIRTVPARLTRRKNDPMAPVVDESPDLLAAVERLSTMLAG